MKINEISHKIIGSAFEVSNLLGNGFLEKVYENALVYELREGGLHVQQQVPLTVTYKSVVVGEYFADLLVENKVLVELKVATSLVKIHRIQCLNYLKATGLHLGLLLNFGTGRVDHRRIVNGLDEEQ